MQHRQVQTPAPADSKSDNVLYKRVFLQREAILATARRYGANNVRLFGSVAAQAESPTSDIDLLVDFEPTRSLLDQIALAQDLEDLLDAPVDVLTVEALHPLLRGRVVASAVPL